MTDQILLTKITNRVDDLDTDIDEDEEEKEEELLPDDNEHEDLEELEETSD